VAVNGPAKENCVPCLKPYDGRHGKQNTMSTPTVQNERKRLNVLWQYEVLDTVPEELFDDLTELAARICEAPIALISLVDEKRQWFKSKIGTTVNETSRDVSFCAYAIQQSGLFIVPDASKDQRFENNPLVKSDPKIRFYAGAPLITPDGYALGTLCVIDTVPRELRPDQKQALAILARHVVSQLELRRRSRELLDVRRQNERSKGELEQLRSQLAEARRELTRHNSHKARSDGKPRRKAQRARKKG
jgi:two-component system cell cycle sensor histidine kinase/response regulator CckA